MVEEIQSGATGRTAAKPAPALVVPENKSQDFAQNLHESLGHEVNLGQEARRFSLPLHSPAAALPTADARSIALPAKGKPGSADVNDTLAHCQKKRKDTVQPALRHPGTTEDAPNLDPAPVVAPTAPGPVPSVPPADAQLANPAALLASADPSERTAPSAAAEANLPASPATAKIKGLDKSRSTLAQPTDISATTPPQAASAPGSTPLFGNAKAVKKADSQPVHELHGVSASLTVAPTGKPEPMVFPLLLGSSINARATRAEALVAGPSIIAAAPLAPEELRTFVVSPNVLEIGLSAGAHGWLRVRAELDNVGAVSAQVTAASVAAAEHLSKEVPAIQAYLATEQVGLSSLIVNAAQPGAGTYNAAAGSGAGTGSQAKQGDPGGRSQGSSNSERANSGESAFTFDLASIHLTTSTFHPGASGGWLSVRV